MTNADKFKGIFGIYATELWAKPEKEFLEWLNEDATNTNIGDTISRQAAIETVGQRLLKDGQRLLKVPSAEPERKKGKWLWVDGVRCSCSNCNHKYKLQTTGLPSVCPNCGAEMEVSEE